VRIEQAQAGGVLLGVGRRQAEAFGFAQLRREARLRRDREAI